MAEEKKVEPIVEPKSEIDIDGILAELEKAQVKTTEDLQGKFKASKEAGQLANILGEVRRENAELRDLIKAQKTAPEDPYGEQKPVDLEESIMRAVEKVEAKKEKRNQEVQGKMLEMWNAITTDEDYVLVKPVWEEKLKDPNFVFRMQSGQVDPLKEYNKTVKDFLKGMATKAGDTIKAMRGPGVPVPHTEKGSQIPVVKQDLSTEAEQRKKLREAASKGHIPTEDEEINTLDGLLKSLG